VQELKMAGHLNHFRFFFSDELFVNYLERKQIIVVVYLGIPF
jgi:hypothetical protein